MRAEVGQLVGGGKLFLDVPRLVATRLLIQGRSGGGKSWTVRRLLEQTHGQIQHLVLDPEGEFASLRERYDYVLAGKGGDIAADPATAALLARRLLELRVSAVLDLYELRAGDRRRFVRLFLEALINAPKVLWHPALIVLDEAHMFCPETGKAESAEAVIELCQRGRKRGFAAVLATQRLANLSKQAAAQCANVMVGPTFIDIDRKRACEILGVPSDRKMLGHLMELKPGQFWCVGAAFDPGALGLAQIGPVETHHPEIAGGRKAALGPPPAPEKVRAMLSKLEGLPQEAADEASLVDRMRAAMADQGRQIARLERELAAARKQGAGIPDTQMQKREAEWQRAFNEKKRERDYLAHALHEIGEEFQAMINLDTIAQAGDRILRILNRNDKPEYEGEVAPAPIAADSAPPSPSIASHSAPRRGISAGIVATRVDSGDHHLRSGARRMLEVMGRHHPMMMTRSQLATLAGYGPKGGTFGTYLSDLKRRDFIEVDGREVRITDAGLAACGTVAGALTAEEILETWRRALRSGARAMLDLLVDVYPGGMSRAELGEKAGYEVKGGTFGTYLSDLRRNGLIEDRAGLLRASDTLFMGER